MPGQRKTSREAVVGAILLEQCKAPSVIDGQISDSGMIAVVHHKTLCACIASSLMHGIHIHSELAIMLAPHCAFTG